MKKIVSIVMFTLLITFSACQSKLSNEVVPLQCKPVLADPIFDVIEINTYINPQGQQCTLFSLLVKNLGQCVDNSPKLTHTAEFYDGDGTKINTLTFVDNNPILLGEMIRSSFYIRFAGAPFVKMSASLATKGHVSNTVTYTIKAPLNAY